MNTLVLCNGQPPPEDMLEECFRWADYFIAADGGANTARKMGHLPDVVIGDLDSYRSFENEPYEIIHDPDQYANDLEKALALAKRKGATIVRVLGATGLRLDHSLKNLSVLKQFDAQFEKITFLDSYVTIALLPRAYTAALPAGTSISLFPLSGKVTGITTKGLKYALSDGVLENGVRDGSSNTVIEQPVQITHKTGDLLLFIAR